MTPSSKPWGIVLEWDEDGLTCVMWLMADIGRGYKRIAFASQANAQWYVDHILDLPDGRDVMSTPRQFS